METIALLIAVAVLVEGLVEYVKTIIKVFTEGDVKTGITQLCAVGIGILLALVTGANIFTALSINVTYSWVGCILTGILISRGSNYLSDLLHRLNLTKTQ